MDDLQGGESHRSARVARVIRVLAMTTVTSSRLNDITGSMSSELNIVDVMSLRFTIVGILMSSGFLLYPGFNDIIGSMLSRFNDNV